MPKSMFEQPLLEVPGGYRAEVARDWEAVPGTPNGGCLASLALRMAGRATAHPRPLSLACQFLQRTDFGPVHGEIKVLRESERMAAVRVSFVQSERHVLEALVWVGSASLPGYEFSDLLAPVQPPPLDCPSALGPPEAEPPFWHGHEFRSAQPEPGTPAAIASGARPQTVSWHRFADPGTYEDPFQDACRYVFLGDVLGFAPVLQAVGMGYLETPYFCPNIDLYVQFHGDGRTEPWLNAQAQAAVATRGTVATRTGVWSRNGALLATSSSTLACRTNPWRAMAASAEGVRQDEGSKS